MAKKYLHALSPCVFELPLKYWNIKKIYKELKKFLGTHVHATYLVIKIITTIEHNALNP
jgi:hypothetical protein